MSFIHVIRILFSVSCYMNDMHILNPNVTNRLMNHCLKSRPSKWTDGYFFWCIYFKITSLKQTQRFPCRCLRYSEKSEIL